MTTRVFVALSLCVASSCARHEPRLDAAKLFDGFTYVGSYPSSPLLRVPESQVSREGRPPRYAKSGLAFVYSKASNETFETLAQTVLPDRLKVQGFAVQATPESNVSSYATFYDESASFTIVFRRGKCGGYLFGRHSAGGQKFVLQLDSDSGCPSQ